MSSFINKIDKNISDMGKSLLHTPKCDSGKYFEDLDKCFELSHIYSTKQSYYIAMAILAYKETKDEKYLKFAESFYDEYYKKATENLLETTQEYGIMYYLYAVELYKITGDKKMRDLAILGADALVKRFIPNRGYIKAWGHINSATPKYVGRDIDLLPFFNENRGIMTADSIINLPLLFWASEETKLPFYKRIAESHIENAIKYLIRKDYSVVNAFRFFEPDGSEVCEENYEGEYSSEQTALMAYGFMMCYNNTKNASYLNTATKIMLSFVKACGNNIAKSDFANDNSNISTLAVAVGLCAIKEIIKYTPNEDLNNYAANVPIKEYINVDSGINGILKEQNGGYDIMGDYFILEYIMSDKAKKEYSAEANLEFFTV